MEASTSESQVIPTEQATAPSVEGNVIANSDNVAGESAVDSTAITPKTDSNTTTDPVTGATTTTTTTKDYYVDPDTIDNYQNISEQAGEGRTHLYDETTISTTTETKTSEEAPVDVAGKENQSTKEIVKDVIGDTDGNGIYQTTHSTPDTQTKKETTEDGRTVTTTTTTETESTKGTDTTTKTDGDTTTTTTTTGEATRTTITETKDNVSEAKKDDLVSNGWLIIDQQDGETKTFSSYEEALKYAGGDASKVKCETKIGLSEEEASALDDSWSVTFEQNSDNKYFKTEAEAKAYAKNHGTVTHVVKNSISEEEAAKLDDAWTVTSSQNNDVSYFKTEVEARA